MARTITEIKKIMTDEFMANSTIRTAYGLSETDTFAGSFSTLSIENILFYIIAACHYTLEVLFDAFTTDVDDRMEKVAHRPKWYRDKVLLFMKDKTLINDSDEYDTTDMTDEQIEEAQVVKFAAATESKDSTILTIKIAGGSTGELTPLDDEVATQVKAYLAEIKDVGVRISLINQSGDEFSCEMDVYYNPLMASSTVKANVESAIKSYVSGLPFNGLYTSMECIDAVQKVEGVEIAEMKSASAKVGDTTTSIDAKYRPIAGYMNAKTLIINMTPIDE